MKQAPYGTWESTISAQDIASQSIVFFDSVGDGEYIYNVERRPNEQGRHVIVRYNESGEKTDILPAPFSARSRVHEYDSRSFTVSNDTIYFVNYTDQNLYYFKTGEQPIALTTNGIRFSELTMTKLGLLAVAEEHLNDGTEAQNYVALINPTTGHIRKLIQGEDFYAFPIINKAGTKIAWVSWKHPNMPWDNTSLWAADIESSDKPIKIDSTNKEQSYMQPGWDANDDLIFISDRTNWWNLYKWQAATNTITALYKVDAEFSTPLWQLGTLSWGFYKNYIFCHYSDDKDKKIVLIDLASETSKAHELQIPYIGIEKLCMHNNAAVFIAHSVNRSPELVRYTPNGKIKVLEKTTKFTLPSTAISIGEHITFPTKGRQKIAHAYYYQPVNPQYEASENTEPPLVVMIHGGPTSATSASFTLQKQFWTSRGFAVADINYGGSSGYGRKYRKSLQRDAEDKPGYWGDIDVKDCIACVEYLVSLYKADPDKVVIRGGSAGGYTTLAALAFSDVFAAGASYYGVSDILALAQDTHKFESRYMDQLIGSLPEFESVYKQRSPINNLDKFTAPLLVLQGDEDKIVLPNQAEMMVKALKERNIFVEYVLYKGEQHGFRKSETIIDSLNRELAFYLSVFYGNTPEHEEKKSLMNRLV